MVLSDSTNSLLTLASEAGTSSKIDNTGADGDHDVKLTNGKHDAASSIDGDNEVSGFALMIILNLLILLLVLIVILYSIYVANRQGGLGVEPQATTDLPRVRSPVSTGILAYLLTQHDEWVASLFRPIKVKTVGKAMTNHPKMPMPENWVL